MPTRRRPGSTRKSEPQWKGMACARRSRASHGGSARQRDLVDFLEAFEPRTLGHAAKTGFWRHVCLKRVAPDDISSEHVAKSDFQEHEGPASRKAVAARSPVQRPRPSPAGRRTPDQAGPQAVRAGVRRWQHSPGSQGRGSHHSVGSTRYSSASSSKTAGASAASSRGRSKNTSVTTAKNSAGSLAP